MLKNSFIRFKMLLNLNSNTQYLIARCTGLNVKHHSGHSMNGVKTYRKNIIVYGVIQHVNFL